MTGSERETRLLRVIARQTLGRENSLWLSENISEGLAWPFVAERAFNEGLAPLLYYHCRNLKLLYTIPESTKKFLARIYAETSLINRHLLREIAELGGKLEKAHIEVIVLKGAALLKTLYRDVALRPMEDIDLIVRQEDLKTVKKILVKMGFSQNRLYPGSLGKGILSIDIHPDFLSSHRIRSRKDILNIRPEDLWSNAIPIGRSSSLYQLSFNDNLIALSFHLLKHRYDRLMWFVDISETIETCQSTLDWQGLIEHSRRLKAERLLLYTLLMTKGLLECNIPEDVLIRLGRENLSLIERYILRLRLSGVPLGTITDLLWIFQIRGTFRKVRFIRENIFPRREIMTQIFPDASPGISTLVKRLRLLSSQILSDLMISLRTIIKGGLPPL